MCVCVRACVRACVRVCVRGVRVRECVCVCFVCLFAVDFLFQKQPLENNQKHNSLSLSLSLTLSPPPPLSPYDFYKYKTIQTHKVCGYIIFLAIIVYYYIDVRIF